MRPILALVLLAAPPAFAGGACDGLMNQKSAQAVANGAPPPGLQRVRSAILQQARAAGRQDVTCEEISRGSHGEGLLCYHGNQIAQIGQADPGAGDGVPLLAASFGDNHRREVTEEGVFTNGKKNFHINGSPGLSVMRAQVIFCETVVGGNAEGLLIPIKNTGEGNGPRVVPAIYRGPVNDEPVLYKT
jgi:hypothetical protein